jgi:hypothetical protein
MSSSRHSEKAEAPPPGALLDLERDLPTTPHDCEVLRHLRDHRPAVATFPDLSSFPAAARSLARRGTSDGWEELTL